MAAFLISSQYNIIFYIRNLFVQTFILLFFLFGTILHAQTDSLSCQKLCTKDSVKPLKFSAKQLYVPAGLSILGASLIAVDRLKTAQHSFYDKHFRRFSTSADDYLAISPVAIAYGLDAIGIKSKTDFVNRTVILVKGQAIQYATAIALKHIVKEERPDGSNLHSFPSNHTGVAFASATFLSEEYRHRFKWMPYAAYTLASGVGVLRIANNKHSLSDVLAGAGIGILSMKLAYWTHQYKWGRKKKSCIK